MHTLLHVKHMYVLLSGRGTLLMGRYSQGRMRRTLLLGRHIQWNGRGTLLYGRRKENNTKGSNRAPFFNLPP